MGRYLNSSNKEKTKKKTSGRFSVNPFMSNPNGEINDTVINKQIEMLEDAVKRYERLEDIKKFTSMALYEIENATEEDIKNALEIEEKISIEDDIAVKKLLESEGLLADIFGDNYPDNYET